MTINEIKARLANENQVIDNGFLLLDRRGRA